MLEGTVQDDSWFACIAAAEIDPDIWLKSDLNFGRSRSLPLLNRPVLWENAVVCKAEQVLPPDHNDKPWRALSRYSCLQKSCAKAPSAIACTDTSQLH